MPTLLEIIESLNAPGPEPEAAGDAEVDEWTMLRPDWPPFTAPRTLPAKLTIEALWRVLWPGDGLYEPDAAELEHAAAAWDAQFPQSHEAMARRAEPNWLAETLHFQREHASAWRWRRVQQLLDADPGGGWHEVDQRRIVWLQQRHQDVIRPVVEAARAAHVRCYGKD